MLRATFKALLARKLRLLLSAMAVVLGVSFVSGALVLTDSLGRAFDQLFDSNNENLAVAVRGEEVPGPGDRRVDVPPRVLAAVRAVDGVAEAQPQLRGEAIMVGGDRKPVTPSGGAFGSAWIDSEQLSEMRIATGAAPAGRGEVAINRKLADEAGKKVGDEAIVLTSIGQLQVRVVGIAQYEDGKDSLNGEAEVLFAPAEAQRVFDSPGGYSGVLVAGNGVPQAELRTRVAAVLPAGVEAITGDDLAKEQSDAIGDQLQFISTFLLVFAIVALFVGSFIIFNTFTILVAQRTRELALLRALGASRRQVTRSVLIEALVVGVIASAAGLLLGIGVALLLKALFNQIGAGLPSGPTVLAPRTVIVAFLVGTVVTALAALIPARKAAKVPPVAAMRDAATPDRSLTRQIVGGSVVLAAGAAAMFFGLTGDAPLWVLGVGTLLAFVGVAMLSPLLSRPVVAVLGSLFARRLPGRLGRQNALRNPRRTASTAAALMIGLALVSAVAVLGASLNSSVRKVVSGSLGAEFILSTKASVIDQGAITAAAAQQGVDQVTPLWQGAIQIDGKDDFAAAVPGSAIGSTLAVESRSGSTRLAPGGMLVDDEFATDRGWTVGRQVEVRFESGRSERLTVGGTYASNELLGNVVLEEASARNFPQKLPVVALVKTADGADLGQVRRGLESATAAYPTVDLQDRSDFTDQVTGQVNQIVQILTVLLVLSIIIAVLGVVNTLALSVLERTRELGLLRAVGMSRRQVRGMIRSEAVMISVFGGLLGLAVGAVFGVALQQALKDQGVSELAFPVGQLLLYLFAAGLIGVLAAVLPARRAARLNVLAAVKSD